MEHKLQWIFHRNSCVFIQENVLEDVIWKVSAILPQPQCVNSLWHSDSTSQPRSGSPGMGFPMLKIRWSRDCLIVNMGIPVLVRQHLYIETVPRILFQYKDHLSRYREFPYKDKMVVRPSYLYNGNSTAATRSSLYWNGALAVLKITKDTWYLSLLGGLRVMCC